MRHNFWAANAVVLGAWELAAAAGQAPTVTRTVRRACARHRGLTRLAVGLWLLGLGLHLLRTE